MDLLLPRVDDVPIRVRLRRSKGWRKPAGVVVVARPSRFGNPFRVGDPAPDGTGPIASRDEAVALFAAWLDGELDVHPDRLDVIRAELRELAGRDLACWCPLEVPCHADVLLRHANP